MSEKEYIVTLKKGVDYDAFNAEMVANTGAGDIPNRTVTVANARPLSQRNTHYSLTDEEATALRNDSRVVDVQIPPELRDDIEIGFNAYQSGVWTRDTVTQQSNLNWGNLRCTKVNDPWNGNTLTDISDNYKYTLTGKGVDVVIQDSGIQPTHWQFTNINYDPNNMYNKGPLTSDNTNGAVFDRSIQVKGVKIVLAGAVGGATTVPDEWGNKVAQMYNWFLDPTAANVSPPIQEKFILTLRGDAEVSWHQGKQTAQRVGYGGGDSYDPNWLTDDGAAQYAGYVNFLDSHEMNDMVWYQNSSGTPGTGDIDAQEVIEHIFHTLHMHGLPAQDLKLYAYLAADWQSGELFAAMEEAFDASKWDPSGYQSPANAWKTDSDAFEVAAKEYLYLLNFCMFDYSSLWDGGSLAPEWTDDVRTPAQIESTLPLGYALFKKYIEPCIAKVSKRAIQSLFRDGDTGNPFDAGHSGYSPDVLSRVQQIDWYAHSGISGTQSANHYRDYNGHGSHCAGTVAGRTLGWAREANIYSVKVNGLEGSGDSGTGISITNCFDVIKGWHNNKPVDPKTGFKRPTVVNASWGYSGTRSGTLTGGVYNGQSWSTGAGQPWPDTEASHLEYAGIHGKYYSLGLSRRINVRVASVDADLQECIDAGVIFCIAAGNSYYYIDSATGPNWNDTANFGLGQENIFRGSSPYDTEAFMVGNIDNTYYLGKEQKAESSCFGPGVDINAPGTYIMSCASSDKSGACDLTDGTDGSVTTVNDPGSNSASDPLMKISGTSMASPQVAGMVACILQANPGMTPAQMKTYIHNNSLQDLLWEDTNHTIVADTFTASTTVANGTTDYTFTAGTDRIGAVSGNDPTITIYQGDTIEITNSIGAHPLYIKTVSGVADTANQVTTPAATGQGATNGTVSWTPALPGRFYYQCSSHADMWGQIEVLPRVDWNNTDNIGDGPNRYLYSPLFSTGDNIQYKGPISRT
jgi:subtilisin family serine protease